MSQPLQPRDGQTLVGPAAFVGNGTVDPVIELKAQDADNVTLKDLDVSGGVHGLIVWEGTHVLGGRYHDNKENGIGGGFQYVAGRTALVLGVEVDHNGSAEFAGNGAGGIKIARLGLGGFTVRDSYIHDNIGNGVWCDVQCIGTYRIQDNRIIHNKRKGVHYEKSGRTDEYCGVGNVCLSGGQTLDGEALILGNVIRNNGWENRSCCDGGIGVVSSINVYIAGNVTSGNHSHGVRLRTDGRLSGEKHGWPTKVRFGPGNDFADGVYGCGSEASCTFE